MRQHEARLKLWIVLALILTSCAGTGQELAARTFPAASDTPSASATPTIGYRETAVAAQQTADEANRLMVEATAQHERLVNDQIAWTAEADRQEMQILSWTATAAPSSIPATQTQAAAVQRAIATQQSIISTAMVMTQTAPTMIVSMANAQNQARYAGMDMAVRTYLLFAMGCFLLAVAVFLFRKPKMRSTIERVAEEPDWIYPLELKTVVEVKKDNGGYPTFSRLTLPCSPDQLTELADGLMSGEKSLGINLWEGRNSATFTRESFSAVRNFLQLNRLAQSIGAGRLVLTADGEAFLRAWRERRLLPNEYDFAAKKKSDHGDMTHAHEDHEGSHGVGEAGYNMQRSDQ